MRGEDVEETAASETPGVALRPSAPGTIPELVEAWALRAPDGPAILAPGRAPLTHGRLWEGTRATVRRLRGLGIGPADRTALVLRNGPEAATAFLGLASACACAPLNPGYRVEELEFYLADLGARALVVDQTERSAAVEAARRMGIRVLRLESTAGEPAGAFTLAAGDGSCADTGVGRGTGAGGATGAGDGVAGEAGAATPGGVALLLHTSGTTSRPKLVPLTHRNLCTSARNVARTLELSERDRCLNVMPLFHIHGLVAAILATLASGGSVVCSDGAYASGFFDWMEEFRPTWYTAVPTMHMGILARAGARREVIERCRLRLVRSSSSPLPPQVLASLEQVLGAPVIEAYGMTEAAHQMASNPLPPAARKPGSVGPAAGPDVAVLSESGELLGPGLTGEVVIRGENVTSGYLDNPDAHRAAFREGWFRTGDLGRLDEDGYLHLAGRLKEMINRGGEKISPREVDEVLLDHPAVAQALTFAVPHVRLGEEVGAAVVLGGGAAATESEIRAHAARRLAAFKVPRVVRFVAELPKGPTGKPQRIGLAARLGIEAIDDRPAEDTAFVAPATATEGRLAALWGEMLGVERVGVRDPFGSLGGDSLLAARMLAVVSGELGADLPFWRFLEEGTIAALAAEIDEASGAERREAAGVVTIAARGGGPALFCATGHEGSVLAVTRLARLLGDARPVYALRPPRLEEMPEGFAVESLAERWVEQITRLQPRGPYRLFGLCFGGVMVYELARQLRARGEAVDLLVMVNALNPAWSRTAGLGTRLRLGARMLRHRARLHARALRGQSRAERIAYLVGRTRIFTEQRWEWLAVRAFSAFRRLDREPELLRRSRLAARAATLRYSPGTYDGGAILLRTEGRHPEAPLMGWAGVIRGPVTLRELPFSPRGTPVEVLAEKLRELEAQGLCR